MVSNYEKPTVVFDIVGIEFYGKSRRCVAGPPESTPTEERALFSSRHLNSRAQEKAPKPASAQAQGQVPRQALVQEPRQAPGRATRQEIIHNYQPDTNVDQSHDDQPSAGVGIYTAETVLNNMMDDIINDKSVVTDRTDNASSVNADISNLVHNNGPIDSNLIACQDIISISQEKKTPDISIDSRNDEFKQVGVAGVTETEEPAEFVANVRDDDVSINQWWIGSNGGDAPQTPGFTNTVRENGQAQGQAPRQALVQEPRQAPEQATRQEIIHNYQPDTDFEQSPEGIDQPSAVVSTVGFLYYGRC